jgi:hypothetical protein
MRPVWLPPIHFRQKNRTQVSRDEIESARRE